MNKVQKIPTSRSSGWGVARYLGNGHLAFISVERSGLAFLHVPSPASRKPVEGWDIPTFSFDIFDYATYPPENVLAVAEQGDE